MWPHTAVSQSYAGDFDGDGDLGTAVSRGSTFTVTDGPLRASFAYGHAGDGVVVGDFDGDGKDTISVRRGNTFHLVHTLRGGQADLVITYGRTGDVPVVGDFDGDGADEIAVRRGATYLVKDALAGGPADHAFTFGRPTDEILVGDFTADGRETLAVVRNSEIHAKNSLNGGHADVTARFPSGSRVENTIVVTPDGLRIPLTSPQLPAAPSRPSPIPGAAPAPTPSPSPGPVTFLAAPSDLLDRGCWPVGSGMALCPQSLMIRGVLPPGSIGGW